MIVRDARGQKAADGARPGAGDEAAPTSLEVRHLRLVRAIAAERSVTRAARRLHLSQSAASHQLVDLEKALGARLFDRVGKRMVLTEAGAQLVDGAGRILAALSAVEGAILARREDGRASVRVTTACYTSYGWLPAIITHFAAAHPRVDVTVVLEGTRRAFEALAADEVDFALLLEAPRDPAWRVERVVTSEVVAVARPDHPVFARKAARAGKSSVRWGALRDAQLLLHDASEALLARIDRAVRDDCQRSGERVAHPIRVQKIPVTEALVELAAAGAGVILADHWLIAPHVRRRDLVARPLHPGASRTFFAVWRKSNPRRLPLEELGRVIAREAERQTRR